MKENNETSVVETVVITPKEPGRQVELDMEKIKEITPYEAVLLNLQLMRLHLYPLSHDDTITLCLPENYVPEELKKYFDGGNDSD